MRLFITAFGSFGKFRNNPSEVLLSEMQGYATKVIPVSYRAVDAFVKKGLPKGYDALLMLGVYGPGCDRMRVEKIARNIVGAAADVEGRVIGPCEIEEGRKHVNGKLFKGWDHRTTAWKPASNAGTFMCNYLYYQTTRHLPGVRTGFVHIPPFKSVPKATQADYLDRVLWRIEKLG